VRALAGDRLDGALDDPARPAAEVVALLGLSGGERAARPGQR
jgi:hypothetical protein